MDKDTDKRWVKQHIDELSRKIKMLDWSVWIFLGLGLTSGKFLLFVFSLIFCYPMIKKAHELEIELKHFKDFYNSNT